MVLIKSKPETVFHDGLFPRSFNSALQSFFDESRPTTQNFNFIPSADILEHSESYEIVMPLPGLKKEEVSITMDGDRLTISGERKLEQKQETSKFLKKEISYGKFSRSFAVGKTNQSGVEAEFTDGVLRVVLPKPVEEKATQISIK